MEIEHSRSIIPLHDSRSSSTNGVVIRSMRRAQSARLFPFSKEELLNVTKPSYARSSSWGDCMEGDSAPRMPFKKSSWMEEAPVLDAVAAASPPFRLFETSGIRRNRGDGIRSVVPSSEAALRIAVDADSGQTYFVERSTMCDACPYCEDVCEMVGCTRCNERRAHLVRSYGSLSLSQSNVAKDWKKRGSSYLDKIHMPATLSERYPRKSNYTLCEIRRRKLSGACWVVCQENVYDVTSFLPDHPGGKRSVLRNAGGRDCEEDFLFHSKNARKQWRQYRIGNLVVCSGDSESPKFHRQTGDCTIS